MMIKTQDGSVVLSINTEYEARYQSTSGPELLFDLVGWLVVFYVPLTARSFRDCTPNK